MAAGITVLGLALSPIAANASATLSASGQAWGATYGSAEANAEAQAHLTQQDESVSADEYRRAIDEHRVRCIRLRRVGEDALVARVIQQDLQSMIQHAHTLACVGPCNYLSAGGDYAPPAAA